jgi:hypothetical protein
MKRSEEDNAHQRRLAEPRVWRSFAQVSPGPVKMKAGQIAAPNGIAAANPGDLFYNKARGRIIYCSTF